jgi:hypothetical protein
MRNVITTREAIIFSISNESNNISISPFVEELKEFFGTKIEHLELDASRYKELMGEVLDSRDSFDRLEQNKYNLLRELEDFGYALKLNAYGADTLSRCKYKFFMNEISKLNREDLDIEKELNFKFYGNLVHSLFEKTIVSGKTELIKGNFDIDRELIDWHLEEIKKENHLKLPPVYKTYYEEILYPKLIDSVLDFFKQFSKLLAQEKIISIEVELGKKNLIYDGEVEVYQSARADLIVTTDKNNYIVDFKTGKKNDLQLDFYAILYFGEADGARKFVYNTRENKLEEADKIKLSNDELSVLVKGLIEEKEYSRTTKSSECGKCSYTDICRMRGGLA